AFQPIMPPLCAKQH
ncbi:bacterial regulatory helix-turn-helix, lysR family protein, partial [Vibrio parahaemolyticus V-223/04]